MRSNLSDDKTIELLKAWEAGLKENSLNPHLKNKLNQKDKKLFYSFSEQYEKLSSLSRRVRRAMQKKWKHSLAGIALVLALGATPAFANDIFVDPSAVDPTPNTCSIIEAIQNANDTTTGQPNADCAAGNPMGADTIILDGSTFTFDGITPGTYTYIGENALPTITSDITIEGNGSTLERVALDEDKFRLIAIDSLENNIDLGIELTLNETRITGGFEPDGGSGASRRPGSGGAILNYLGTLNLNDCVIEGNEATTYGGGISVIAGDMTINDSVISGNNAISGGGIYTGTVSVNITINNSIISDNFATGGLASRGGGIYNYSVGILTVNNSTISGNMVNGGALSTGGGISSRFSPGNAYLFSINNSTISGNEVYGATSNLGGGIFAEEGDMVITNSTISNNEAGDGGGIFVEDDTDAQLTLTNTIIANSTNGDCVDTGAGSVTDGGNNLIQNTGSDACNLIDTVNDNRIGIDPNLGPLQNNGGSTPTHALLAGSQAINNGNNTVCSTAPIDNLDQRLFPRDDGNCDIGSYEAQSTGTISVTKNTDPMGGTDFSFMGTNFPEGCELEDSFTLDDSETKSCVVPLGDYTVTETVPGSQLLSIDCEEMNSATSSDDNNNPAVNITLAADEDTVDCIFTNEADNDMDGIPNSIDNCPDDANADQTDADNDMMGDVCDMDDDNDGDNDDMDNCPFDSNADQANNDGDTLGDVCDNCPNDTNEDQMDFDSDGMGDVCDDDDDNDGVLDTNDSDPMNQQVCSDTDMDTCDDCTNTTDTVNQGGNPADDGTDTDADGTCSATDMCDEDVNKTEPGACGCGVGETDTDSDTVADCIDNCPDDANTTQADTDNDNIGDACDMDNGDGDGDGDGDNEIEIGNEQTDENGISVQIAVGDNLLCEADILVDLPSQVLAESANLSPNIGDCFIVDQDASNANVTDVDVICEVDQLTSLFELELGLCANGEQEGLVNAEIEVVAECAPGTDFDDVVQILLNALDDCGDGSGGCTIASANTSKANALSNFLVTLIPAIVGFAGLFFRRKKEN